MLQDRISELNNGILYIKENNLTEVFGFYNIERLEDYYLRNIKCFSSQGLYPTINLDFGKTKDNSLFIIIKNNIEVARYNFKVISKGIVKYKGTDEKMKSKTYKIRKCNYSTLYNFVHLEPVIKNDTKTTIEIFHTFNSLDLLKDFFFTKFSKKLII